MFSFEWPGTKEGCNCHLWDDTPAGPRGRDGEFSLNNEDNEWMKRGETKEDVMARLKKFGQENKIYAEGLCDWKQTQAGCLDIAAINPMTFSKWKQHTLWCVVRAQAINMATMRGYYDNEKGECTDDTLRVCGDPNDKTYQFCFPKAYPYCPINGIMVTNQRLRGEQAIHFNSHPILFSRYDTLYFSRTLPATLPISNFVISEDMPCTETDLIKKSKDFGNFSPNRTEHPLLKHQRHSCGNQTDIRYDPLDKQGEQSFFFNNNALYLRDVLPNFHLDNSFSFSIWKRHYVEWKHNCTSSIQFFHSNEVSEQFKTRQMTLQIVTYVVSSITIIISFLEMLLICNVLFIANIEKPLLQWSPCIQVVLQLIALPFCAAALHHAIVLSNTEEALTTSNCTDPFTLKLLATQSLKIHHQVANYNKEQIIFIALLLFVNVFIVLAAFCCSGQGTHTKKKRRASTY